MYQQGLHFENQARLFLEKNGLRFIASNQRFKCGELDLIMKQENTFIFVEVRQRKNANFGSAVESISYSKQKKWLNAANLWLTSKGLSLDTADCRFDVVAFEGNNPPLWIENFLD